MTSASNMGTARATPVIVGVGDFKNRSQKAEDAVEPLQLILTATRLAIEDTNLPATTAAKLQSSIDSIDVIATWTWNYHDLPGLLATQLGFRPKHKLLSEHGGNSPVKMFDDAARRIALGQSNVAVVTGGEALASRQYPPRCIEDMRLLLMW